jgi:hypothetical protein
LFLIFGILIAKKILFKFLLASMKTHTNSGDFTGSRIRISSAVCHGYSSSLYNNTGAASKRMGNLNSAFEKSTANHIEK